MEALVRHPRNRSNPLFQALSFSSRPCSNDQHLGVMGLNSTVLTQYLRLLSDSTLLYMYRQHTINNKATGMHCNIFPLLSQDSMLSQKTKLTLQTVLF